MFYICPSRCCYCGRQLEVKGEEEKEVQKSQVRR